MKATGAEKITDQHGDFDGIYGWRTLREMITRLR